MSKEKAFLSKLTAHTFAEKRKKGALLDSMVTYEIELKSVTVNKGMHPLRAALLKDTISGENGLKVIVAGKGNGAKIEEKDEVTIWTKAQEILSLNELLTKKKDVEA